MSRPKRLVRDANPALVLGASFDPACLLELLDGSVAIVDYDTRGIPVRQETREGIFKSAQLDADLSIDGSYFSFWRLRTLQDSGKFGFANISSDAIRRTALLFFIRFFFNLTELSMP